MVTLRNPEGKTKRLNTEESAEFLEKLFKEGLLPHVDAIRRIASFGDTAVCVFEHREDPSCLRLFGQKGDEIVFPLATRVRKLYESGRDGPVTKAWMRRPANKTHVKVLFLAHWGCLLVNWTAEKGWHLEPNSLDCYQHFCVSCDSPYAVKSPDEPDKKSCCDRCDFPINSQGGAA